MGSNERDAEIQSLRIALDMITKEKESADNQVEEVNKTLVALTTERDLAVQDRDDLKQVNKMLQTELNTREEELQQAKANKLDVGGSSNVQKASRPQIISTDDRSMSTQMVELKKEVEQLFEVNTKLQKDNNQLKSENSALLSKLRRLSEMSDSQKDDKVPCDVAEKQMVVEQKSPGAAVIPSVVTSVTVDMDRSEDELARLSEENQLLRRQLQLLRVNSSEFSDIPDDQEEYDESVVPESSTSEYIGDANEVPDSVMKQICSEVEMVTEEVIIKTRAESEARIAELQKQLEDLTAEMERSKRLAKYDLDDMTRVNRSLREDLEEMGAVKIEIEQELEETREEYDTLNEDIERFAETFATQHEELQQLERQAKRLQSENEELKERCAEDTEIIQDLEAKLKEKWVGGEITKLWDEIERLREAPTSVDRGERSNRPTQSSSSDISSEEAEAEGTADAERKGSRSPLLSLFGKGSASSRTLASPPSREDKNMSKQTSTRW